MSLENVDKLRKMITKDAALQARLNEPNEGKFIEILVGIGAERNLPFTTAEVRKWATTVGPTIKLSENQLKSVAGAHHKLAKSDGTSYSYGSDWRCGVCGSSSGTWGTGQATAR